MRKDSTYKRDSTLKEIKRLKEKYIGYTLRRTDGFLNKRTRDLLLQEKKWDSDTTPDDISNFYYDIRERARAALEDFKLLCDVLNENELKDIFAKHDPVHWKVWESKNLPHIMRSDEFQPPIVQFLSSLIPTEMRRHAKKPDPETQEQQKWRGKVLEGITIRCLEWYLHSGMFKPVYQRRMIADVMELIVEVTQSGRRIGRDQYDINSGDID